MNGHRLRRVVQGAGTGRGHIVTGHANLTLGHIRNIADETSFSSTGFARTTVVHGLTEVAKITGRISVRSNVTQRTEVSGFGDLGETRFLIS
jgi:hypothetical protein